MDAHSSPVIFVLDKNPIHRSLIKYHLNVNRFFNVQTFNSFDECNYRLNKGHLPDYLILDYTNDNTNSFEYLKVIQRMSPQTRVLFFSSYDDPILAVRLLDAGAVDYVSKTSKLEIGLRELIKNLKFLIKETAYIGKNL